MSVFRQATGIDRRRLPGPCLLAGVAAIVAVAPLQSAEAQNVLGPSARFAAEADAVRESVPVRRRPEFEPIGILLGDLLSAGSTTGDGSGLAVLPTPRPVNPGKLRKLDSADGEIGLLRAGNGTSGRGLSDVLGSFVLRPRLVVDGVFDDNIFRSDQNKESDFITVLRPSLRLVSDWNNHGLILSATGAIGRYADFGSEDFEDYSVSATPKFDVTEDNVVNVNLSHSRNHEDRSGIEPQLQGTVPSVNRFWSATTDWTYSGSAITSFLRYSFLRQDANDAGVVDRQIFDRDLHGALWRLGWQFSPGRTVWVQPEYQLVEHRIFDVANNFDRDNQGWQFLAGMTFELSAVSFLEFGAGYVTRTFEEPTKDDYGDFAYRLRGLWNITPLVTLDLSAGRSVTVEDGVAASAAVTDEVNFRAAWDPLEQLILSATLGYSQVNFEDLPGFSREETVFRGGLNLRYLLNPNVFVEADFKHADFDSTIASDVYKDNQFMLRAGVEL